MARSADLHYIWPDPDIPEMFVITGRGYQSANHAAVWKARAWLDSFGVDPANIRESRPPAGYGLSATVRNFEGFGL